MNILNRFLLNAEWKFMQAWSEEMIAPDYDDSQWRAINLPHDWSIEGRFSEDAVNFARGAYLPTGCGCYRKKLVLNGNTAGKCFKLYFEGVFKNSSVFVNGHLAGGREWGYLPFEVDLTPYLAPNGENVIVVKVDNSEPISCRWYSGSGIYRNVYLESYEKLWFVRDAMQIVTDLRDCEHAVVNINYRVKNNLATRTECQVIHTIYDCATGEVVAQESNPHRFAAGLDVMLSSKLTVDSPILWNLDEPHLYCLKSQIICEGKCLHAVEERFGFRSFEYNADYGLFLNGRHVKIKGCCLHNDGGALGTAVTRDSFIRQIRILKTMGCNAVRTSHNPYSPQFLDVCDELGVLVLDECFDSWEEPQRCGMLSNGEYHFTETNYYPQFARDGKQDLAAFVMRDRNHPSVFMWSIGNEVKQMFKFSGERIAGELTEVVHNYDETRPVTCAVVVNKLRHENIDRLDVGGYNYLQLNQVDDIRHRHPNQPMLVTECYSVQTRHPRGKYYAEGKLKAALSDYYPIKFIIVDWLDKTLIGQENWDMVEERDYIMGEFIWTGWDYLGEPTPYDYPAHSSFFGVIDTTGYPKDGYFYYRAAWTNEPVVHIASHWDYECGDTVTLLIYSNCASVELFVNGKSYGKKYPGDGFKRAADPNKSCVSDDFTGDTTRRMFMWTVPYEPGVVEAIGIFANGDEYTHLRDKVTTSGAPASLRLSSCPFNADDAKILYIDCEVLDATQQLCRNSESDVTWHFESSQLRLKGLDNGNQLCEEPYQGINHRKCCAGRSIAIFERLADDACVISATSPGLSTASLVIPPRSQKQVKKESPAVSHDKHFVAAVKPVVSDEAHADVSILTIP